MPERGPDERLAGRLAAATWATAAEKQAYYRQWLFNQPIILTAQEHEAFQSLQRIMYKLVQAFAGDYLQRWSHLMPVTSEVAELLALWEAKPYRAGTYRTDFVYDGRFQPRIIEITCRFAMNAFFSAAIFNQIAADWQCENCLDEPLIEPYPDFFRHFATYLNGSKRVYVLTGGDLRNESRLLSEILPKAGIEMLRVPCQELPDRISEMADALIISELSHEELLQLPRNTLEALSSMNLINDPRTIFLIHDKRFFSVMGHAGLQEAVLDVEEIALFRDFYIPTHQFGECPEAWLQARCDRQDWVLKHRNLGKSQEVHAGIVTSADEWERLFERQDLEDFVLQRWIPQGRLHGWVGAEEHLDYVAGTLLFFDDRYFGPGEFRTSSFPVSNKADHGKAFSLALASSVKPAHHGLKFLVPDGMDTTASLA